MKEKIILFVCKGNSGRSQIAEAFLNHLFKTKKAISAGIKPDKKIHPWTIKLMKEVKIDVSKQKPRLLTDKLMGKVDRIIVMDPDLSKSIPKKYLLKLEAWKMEKLFGKSIKRARQIRDEIKRKVKQLSKRLR